LDLRAPRSIEELGIPGALLQDLVLRRALFEGRTSTLRLANALSVSIAAMSKVVEELRELRHLEVLGIDQYDYQLELTMQGREVANERMQLCRYAGAAPVSLAQYVEVVKRQTAEPIIAPDTMREAFKDLVVNERLLNELGPALLTQGAMFLYGPPGTGKTSISERLIRVHPDLVLIPKAVEVDSQIITVFDPVVHVPADVQPDELDPRWVLCRRPSIIAGGELQRSMLDLTYEPSNGVYLAPIQMQANNGVLVIDDFGRQLMTPEELLNRWIVPLDRRIDYLSLSYGVRFEIPFDCKVVFSTNLEPAALGDEAFFRRIQNKILVPSITDEEFDIVLHRAAKVHDVELSPGAEEYLRKVSREQGDGDLRPYLPNEVCKILKSISAYFNIPRVLSKESIDRIAAIYFTHAMRGAPPPSLLTTLVQEDAKRDNPPVPAAATGVQQATDAATAQRQRQQAGAPASKPF
jgi:hypothetical protein